MRKKLAALAFSIGMTSSVVLLGAGQAHANPCSTDDDVTVIAIGTNARATASNIIRRDNNQSCVFINSPVTEFSGRGSGFFGR